jgi:hypothetical protein
VITSMFWPPLKKPGQGQRGSLHRHQRHHRNPVG